MMEVVCGQLEQRLSYPTYVWLQLLPDVPPAMADTVNRGSELLASLTAGTPLEAVAKEVGSTFSPDSRILRAQASSEVKELVEVIASWVTSNSGPKLLQS